MTFRKINFEKIYKSFIWITSIIALIAGFSLYKYGSDSWEILNNNGKVNLEYIIRLAFTITSFLISFAVVLYIDLKRSKKVVKFKDLALVISISFILNILLYISLANYSVFIGKIDSFRFISSLFYLNQITFTIGIFLYVFKYKMYSTSRSIQNILKELLVIFSMFLVISAILFCMSDSEERYDFIIIFASIIVSIYSALFIPIQMRALTRGREDKDFT